MRRRMDWGGLASFLGFMGIVLTGALTAVGALLLVAYLFGPKVMFAVGILGLAVGIVGAFYTEPR